MSSSGRASGGRKKSSKSAENGNLESGAPSGGSRRSSSKSGASGTSGDESDQGANQIQQDASQGGVEQAAALGEVAQDAQGRAEQVAAQGGGGDQVALERNKADKDAQRAENQDAQGADRPFQETGPQRGGEQVQSSPNMLPEGHKVVSMPEEMLNQFRRFQAMLSQRSEDYTQFQSYLRQSAVKSAGASETKLREGDIPEATASGGGAAKSSSSRQSVGAAVTFKPQDAVPAAAATFKQGTQKAAASRASAKDPNEPWVISSSSNSPSSPIRAGKEKDTRKEGKSHKQEPEVSVKTTPKKRTVVPPKCPRCGDDDPDHDWLSCKAPKHGGPRSTEEQEFLKQLGVAKRWASVWKLRHKQQEDSDSEGEDLEESDGSDSEEDDSDEEEEEEDDEEEDEQGGSSSSSDPSYQPTPPEPAKKKKSKSVEPSVDKKQATPDRLEKLEEAVLKLTGVLSSLTKPAAKQPKKPASVASDSDSPKSRSRSPASGKHLSSKTASKPSPSKAQATTGMEGCPEFPRKDLLQLDKFEQWELKYKEYVGKANDRHRTFNNMTYGFRKFNKEVRSAIRSLFDKTPRLRTHYGKASTRLMGMTEDDFAELDNEVFKRLYRELCTQNSTLPSQLLIQLESTVFDRTDGSSLPKLIIQASTAFRERLQGSPQQTVESCTDRQLKDAFVRMLLGSDERNLADFASARTWEEAVDRVLELEGSAQAHTMMTRIIEVGQQGWTEVRSRGVGGAARGGSAGGGGASGNGGMARSSASRPAAGGGPENKMSETSPPTRQAPTSQVSDAAWKQQFETLQAQFQPTAHDLLGCSTYQQKCKRIFQIRDTRAREKEMQALRATLGGSEAVSEADKSKSGGSSASSTPSRSQLGGTDGGGQGVKCYNCNGFGHIKKDCPEPPREKGRGRTGHQSSDSDA